jgi:hypothetical protein
VARQRKDRSTAAWCFRAVAASLLLAGSLFPGVAAADEAGDLKASIVVRCLYSAGEFGTQLVDICVRDDLDAVQALQAYPRESAAMIEWCTHRLQVEGWVRVKMCVDENAEAEAALATLGPLHGALIDACREKLGREGAARVRACVDKGIKSGSGD